MSGPLADVRAIDITERVSLGLESPAHMSLNTDAL
jgi:hypothetical protein